MDALLTVILFLVFVGATICWSVAFTGSARPTWAAIAGNGAVLTLLFLSMQPARVAKHEIVLVSAFVPIASLFLVEGSRN